MPESASRRLANRTSASDFATIEQLEEAASTCRLCRLCRDRTQVVRGAGSTDARIVVITDTPGYHDDRSGELFTGRSGVLLDEVFEIAGIDRRDVFITSAIKCRPPSGRSPYPDEVAACESWLFRQLAILQPNVVITLGSLPLRLLTGRFDRLTDVHGTMMHITLKDHDVVVWPLYQPTAAAQVESIAEALREDARALGILLRGVSVSTKPDSENRAELSGASEPSDEPKILDDEPQLAFEF